MKLSIIEENTKSVLIIYRTSEFVGKNIDQLMNLIVNRSNTSIHLINIRRKSIIQDYNVEFDLVITEDVQSENTNVLNPTSLKIT